MRPPAPPAPSATPLEGLAWASGPPPAPRCACPVPSARPTALLALRRPALRAERARLVPLPSATAPPSALPAPPEMRLLARGRWRAARCARRAACGTRLAGSRLLHSVASTARRGGLPSTRRCAGSAIQDTTRGLDGTSQAAQNARQGHLQAPPAARSAPPAPSVDTLLVPGQAHANPASRGSSRILRA
jgi:hypothetical protein